MHFIHNRVNVATFVMMIIMLLWAAGTYADNQWGSYRILTDSNPSSTYSYRGAPSTRQSNAHTPYGYSSYKGYADPYGTPLPQQQYPIRPPLNQRPYPPHYSKPHYPVYPQQNGVTIIYQQQLPVHTEYHTEYSSHVNGQGSIQSSTYTLISDWQRYGLPAPQAGMHWVYQNGRYLQIHNQP